MVVCKSLVDLAYEQTSGPLITALPAPAGRIARYHDTVLVAIGTLNLLLVVESRRKRGGVQSRRRLMRTRCFRSASSPSGSSLGFLLPARRTGRAHFEHPALGRGSHLGMHGVPFPFREALQGQKAELPEHPISWDAPSCAAWRLPASAQEEPHEIVDIGIYRVADLRERSEAEVARPAAQHAVEALRRVTLSFTTPRRFIRAHLGRTSRVSESDNALPVHSRPPLLPGSRYHRLPWSCYTMLAKAAHDAADAGARGIAGSEDRRGALSIGGERQGGRVASILGRDVFRGPVPVGG
jgi:hypothetical protein